MAGAAIGMLAPLLNIAHPSDMFSQILKLVSISKRELEVLSGEAELGEVLGALLGHVPLQDDGRHLVRRLEGEMDGRRWKGGGVDG